MAIQRDMALNLVDQIKGYLTPDVIQAAAAHLGESPGATQKALAGIVPALIGGLTNTASTNEGAQQLVRMLDAGKYDGSALDHMKSPFGSGMTEQSAVSAGKGILDSLVGAKLAGVTDFIARFAGIRTGSASSLLAMVAPLVMQVLGRQRTSLGLGPTGLANLLGEQRSSLKGLMPAGLGSLLGWSGAPAAVSDLGAAATGAATTAAGAVSDVTRAASDALPRSKRASWPIAIGILGILALGILAWLMRPTTPTAPVSETARKISQLQLPGGASISVPEGSFNFSVANWLAGTTDTSVPKRFLFDDLKFETGSTTLTPDSVATVSSLVAVLKAYPAVAVTLEGHTDNTGDPAANKKLSLDRADAVRQLMINGGIDGARIAATGSGQENPIASNETDQGRAQNRRLEMVVEKR